jgi:DEAD/DEAH box helicase domain-containing protein
LDHHRMGPKPDDGLAARGLLREQHGGTHRAPLAAPSPSSAVQGPNHLRRGGSNGTLAYLDVECQLTAAEVGGFHPHQTRQRRLAVAVAHFPASQRFVTYQEREVMKLAQALHEVDLVIGYNLRAFDLELLRGYPGTDVEGIQAFDLCEDLRRISGRRWPLDLLAGATLDLPPTLGGDNITAMFRRGDLAGCVAACQEDVRRIAQIHQFGAAHGVVYGYRPGVNERVRIPVRW